MRHAMATLTAALMATASLAQVPPGDAASTDPVRMGWMQGDPVPPDKLIEFQDGGHYAFPKTRWSFSNYNEFFSTVIVSRGPTSSPLPRAERTDLDGVTFTPLGGGAAMTWAEALPATYTDGILIFHKGKVVYERYFGVTRPDSQHIAFSITKSFVGTIAASLIMEGALDPNAEVATILPELAQSGFGDATVRQVMDMTTGLDFDETYTDGNSGIARHAYAGGIAPRRPDYNGPEGFRAFLATVKKRGEHGERFTYRTINTDTLGWIVERVTGQKLFASMHLRFWEPLGMESDAAIQLDVTDTAFAGGGLMLTLRDLARFGEAMRLGGKGVIPASAIADITRGANKEGFAKAGIPTLPGWSYRNQWWISHDPHGAYMARGVHGQSLYIDPKAEMVIARFGSHPVAGNVANDPVTIPAFHAMAEHLMR